MKNLRAFLLGVAAASLAFTGLAAAQPVCSGDSQLVSWPDTDPVWELCWLRPIDSSGINGSGIDLHDVFYRDQLVLSRAHAPILNVEYDAGGCGCFRDWSHEEERFQADNELAPGYAEPTSPPLAVCDTGGPDDSGSFYGVAAEKLADRLVLTSQMSAGWYRYLQKWTFHQDGRIEPFFGFTSVDASCIETTHRHHNYWRLDFNIDGAGGDYVVENNAGKIGRAHV